MRAHSIVFVVAAMLGTACVLDKNGDDHAEEDDETNNDSSGDDSDDNDDGSGAPQSNPSLRVVNESSYTVYEVYVWRCSETGYGVDQLSTSIPPHGTFTLTNIPPGCWKFRAETAGNVYWQNPGGVTLSTGQQYTWTLKN